MANSLQSSCTLLASTSHRRISPFPKPSQSHLLLTRSRHFRVSCNGGGSEGSGRVDRRNMLIGLGGLYGAANLISDPMAYADPVQAPDLTKCGLAYPKEPTVDGDCVQPLQCCPPTLSDHITDYVLPPVEKLRMRPAAHTLSPEYLAKYEEAIRLMKALDKSDPDDPRGFKQQANIHCAYCNNAYYQEGSSEHISIHFNWLFFPFHRWYLYFYERILGSLIGDPTFALPYWNWDNPPGMMLPKIFDDPNSPLYDVNRNPSHRPPQILDLTLTYGLDEDEEKVISSNLNMISKELRRVDTFEDFMGGEFKAGKEPPGQGGSVELGSHTAVHRWVGHPDNKYHEDLGNFYSAGRDPAFFSHHANVDRMWTIWQNLKTTVSKTCNDPDYLNASFLFYDENKQLVRVKVADSLDNKKMGFDYQKQHMPWMYYAPPRRAGGVPIKDISKGVETADKVFPLKLDQIVRVLVDKTAKGKAEEVLVLRGIKTDHTKFIKFDVYINDDDDDSHKDVAKAEYAGTFAHLPHRGHHNHGEGTVRFSLTELYEDIKIDDNDDKVVVTIVPRFNGQAVTIGGIRIVKSRLPPSVLPGPLGSSA